MYQVHVICFTAINTHIRLDRPYKPKLCCKRYRGHEMNEVPKCCPSDPAQEVLSPFTHQLQLILNLNVMTLVKEICRPLFHMSSILTYPGLGIYAVSCWSRPLGNVQSSLHCSVQEAGTIFRLEEQQHPSARRIYVRLEWWKRHNL